MRSSEQFKIQHSKLKIPKWHCRTMKMYEILNKQVKSTQYIGTCKSAYTKGYALN